MASLVLQYTLWSIVKNTLWTSDTSKGVTCKGIDIKFTCGGSAAGFVYSIYIVILNPSKQEIPNDDVVVVHIKGISINGHTDLRSEEVGYVYLIGSNLPQSKFFIDLTRTLHTWL